MTITEKIHKLYKQFKKEHPDAVILMRCGDFYETYEDDAVTCHKELDITLTNINRPNGTFIRVAGFPHFALDTYLPRLIRAGYKVCITD